MEAEKALGHEEYGINSGPHSPLSSTNKASHHVLATRFSLTGSIIHPLSHVPAPHSSTCHSLRTVPLSLGACDRAILTRVRASDLYFAGMWKMWLCEMAYGIWEYDMLILKKSQKLKEVLHFWGEACSVELT
ncbi:hypothetical protein VNO78_09020 [Psophocarpus tetragonolobus]|uniref:Uncharacterized protein n=1 Tax=Psophocarpus tetragonolobus TaxID=3891 RepID=A0AAN9T722_PSOTE